MSGPISSGPRNVQTRGAHRKWFDHALDKTKATASEDASLGFYIMARAHTDRRILAWRHPGCEYRNDLVKSVDRTRVADLGYEQLWNIYNTSDPSNPRNKNIASNCFNILSNASRIFDSA
ncbi:hypothetical protein OPQ81_009400 [Rhizoctonia solani]|nr:hypothetical protein OPQ81_009400 [Rhizoctonia solani]